MRVRWAWCRGFLIRALEVLLMATVALLVIDVVWGVFTRYVMGRQAKWSEELARYLLIWVVMLGVAVAFEKKKHLGLDYLTNKFHPDLRRFMATVVHVITLIFALAIFVYGGVRFVGDTLAVEQVTPSLGLKIGYVYLALPISGAFIVLFVTESLIDVIRGKGQEIERKGERL